MLKIFLETKDIFHNKNIDERIYLTRIQKLTILVIVIIIIIIIRICIVNLGHFHNMGIIATIGHSCNSLGHFRNI